MNADTEMWDGPRRTDAVWTQATGITAQQARTNHKPLRRGSLSETLLYDILVKSKSDLRKEAQSLF